MTSPRTIRTAILLLASSSALAACASKAPKQLPPDPGANVSTNTAQEPVQGNTITPGSQADFVAQMMGQDTIYFDTDRYNIDSADMTALQAQAQWLAQYPGKRATVEGHARANAAKNYLVSVGIDAARLSTVSYGKERPVALGSDEASWAKNRRAVTITID